MQQNGQDLYKYLDTAKRAAGAAGELLLQLQGSVAVEYKSSHADLVTAADREAEHVIVEILRSEFPDDRFITEEAGASTGSGTNLWFIDPLDGTTNFAHGLDLFAVSIGLERDGQLVVGVIHVPALGVTYSAVRGGGAWRNDKRLHVSNTETLAQSLLATGIGPDRTRGTRDIPSQIAHLVERSRGVRMLGSTAIHLAYVAEGRLDGYWAPDPQAWDVAAGIVLVEEAGGKVTALDGGALDLQRPRVLATNGRVHDEMVRGLGESVESAKRIDGGAGTVVGTAAD